MSSRIGLDPASRNPPDTAFAGRIVRIKIIDITTEFAYISAIGKQCLIKPGSFRSRPFYLLVAALLSFLSLMEALTLPGILGRH